MRPGPVFLRAPDKLFRFSVNRLYVANLPHTLDYCQIDEEIARKRL